MRLVRAILVVSVAAWISGCARGLPASFQNNVAAASGGSPASSSQPGTGTTPTPSPAPPPAPTPSPTPTPTPTPVPTPTPAPTLSFSAQPQAVRAGGSVTLTWSSTNADSVSIDNGIGGVAKSGSMQVEVDSSTTFTATATGAGGSVQQQASVTVLPKPDITVTVCPETHPSCSGGASTQIRAGSSAVISWNAQNADSVNIDQVPGQQFGAQGSYTTPALNDAAVYKLTATGNGGAVSVTATVDVVPMVPIHKHVAFLVEENYSYSQVIGNAKMPYLNQLAQEGAVAVEYYANTHGSLRDYFELTAGQFLVAGGDYDGFISADNIAAHVSNAGKTWRSYAEALPNAGYTGYNVYPYEKDHNPFAYFTDITNDSSEAANLVPLSRLATDLAQGSLPNLIYIAPDAQHDAHDCPTSAKCTDQDKLAAADQWLKSNIDPLLQSSAFKSDGVLLLTFDEGANGDNQGGGGHVVMIAIGPKVKPGFHSHNFYQHQNALKTMCEALDLESCPGDAADA
ncbi:MAG: hypothetical protein JO065_15600, partial [Acidobacteria bacterium]|nr:hypothetical protein [Acidobacteriota bacterium]